ncbi:UNVERIFIED_CONTAM: hypothetical protein RMT77_013266 [Armadillidium vulgare]
MSSKPSLSILRSFIHELRHITQNGNKLRDSSLYEYVVKQFRQNNVTDLQYCREKDELAFSAQTFVTYLNSRRNLKKLHEEYHGRGERSIRDTANIVGFKLPHDPK